MAEKKGGEELYLFLKKRCPNCLDANVEIIIKSRTFKKTEAGYDEYNSSRIYNRIDRFDENKFEIIALGYTLNIPYENLDYWELDECNPNKIYLHLNKAIVLYEKEKIELKDF